MNDIKIPVGLESFELIRTSGFYYIDKTRFIAELVQDAFSVNLITRPRRFGKTLMMSMLESFFDIRKDSRAIFVGLEITENTALCEKWMNQWPVLFLSFKDIASNKFKNSYEQLMFNISSLYIEHEYLLKSGQVNVADKECFMRLMMRTASEAEVRNSLFLLTRMMYMHYGKPVILLLDEYDVPLSKANGYGYYDEMLDLVRSLLSTALKTNLYLKFAVVTGCLRIARESIFTGANLFVMNSIHEGGYMDAFGFTEEEVRKLLKDAGFESHLPDMKRWYDGYRFGDYEIYCPWDVVNYAAALLKTPDKKPGNYWKDTSHNNIIKSFIDDPDIHVNDQFEMLLAGGEVAVRIKEDLTYQLEESEDRERYFWSILYLTGYLTKAKESSPDWEIVRLRIPNEEVKTIFTDTIVEWFRDTMKSRDRKPLFEAWWSGDEVVLTEMVSEILFETISYFDYREDYYHAFLAGLFAGAGYNVSSNTESGLGRTDIVVKDRKSRRALIIEAKRSESKARMESDCEKALEQIRENQYARPFESGYQSILCYGAAFFEKSCMIRKFEVKGNRERTAYDIE